MSTFFADPRPGRETEDSADGLALIWGQKSLMERLCGLDFAITPLSFFQTNTKQTETLYRVVRDAAGNYLVSCAALLRAIVSAALSILDMQKFVHPYSP